MVFSVRVLFSFTGFLRPTEEVIREVKQTEYSIRFGKDRVENCTEISVDTQSKITFSRQKYDRPYNCTPSAAALVLGRLAVENRGPCVPKKFSLSNCASPGDSFCQVFDDW